MALGYGTAQFISNWERGVALPPKDSLRIVCSLYDIKPKVMIDLLVKCHEACYRLELLDLMNMKKAS